MPKYIYPTVRHDVSDNFQAHRSRQPPSVNPGTDYKTWASDYSTHKRPVFAVADGTVRVTSAGGGIWYIEYVDIYGVVHQDLHVSAIWVRPGQEIKQREQIGITGDTGAPGSPHLHHSMKIDGRNVDFELYLTEDSALAELDTTHIEKRTEEIEMAQDRYFRRAATGEVALLGSGYAQPDGSGDNRHIFATPADYNDWRSALVTTNNEITRLGGDPRGLNYIPPADLGQIVGLDDHGWEIVCGVYGV